MRTLEEYDRVSALKDRGYGASAIAHPVGIPRSTVRGWMDGPAPGATRRALAEAPLDLPACVYLLGIYLGDGCISEHACGIYRLRLHLDLGYPGIVDECHAAMQAVAPRWAELFPQHGPGRKHERPIELTAWQRDSVRADP